MTNVVVLVLAYNGEHFLRPCLDALMRQDYAHDFGVLVVDNASLDGSAGIVRSYADVTLMESDTNRGFAGGNNVGLRAVCDGRVAEIFGFHPETVVLLNQDTEVAPDWLTQINAAWQRHPQAGVIGCKAFAADGTTLQHAGGTLLWPLGTGTHRGAGEPDHGQYDEDAPVEFVTGAALAIRTDLLSTVGLLDEGFSPAYYEDVDYCYRVRAAGFDVMYAPAARLLHHEGTSLVLRSANHQRIYHRSRVRFLLKWRSLEQLEQWVPEERAEIERWSTSDSLARKQAYLYGLLALPRLIVERANISERPEAYGRIVDMLKELHGVVLQEESRARSAAGYTFVHQAKRFSKHDPIR